MQLNFAHTNFILKWHVNNARNHCKNERDNFQPMEDYSHVRNNWNSIRLSHKYHVKRKTSHGDGNRHGTMIAKYAGGRCSRGSSVRGGQEARVFFEQEAHDQEGMLVIQEFCSACFWCCGMSVSKMFSNAA